MSSQINGVGITNDGTPASTITVGGSIWKLRRDATDASMEFPHKRVNWLDSGCEYIADDHDHFVWIRGVIPAREGTIEKPLNVMYVGFHPEKISVMPNTIFVSDVERMHVYVNDSSGFAVEFCNQFLGVEKPEVREPVKSFPSARTRKAIKEPKAEEPEAVKNDEQS